MVIKFDSERELEDYVEKHFLDCGYVVLRQLRVPGAGIPDLILINVDDNGKPYIVVCELKNTEATVSAFAQCSRYMFALRCAYPNITVKGAVVSCSFSEDCAFLSEVSGIQMCSVGVGVVEVNVLKFIKKNPFGDDIYSVRSLMDEKIQDVQSRVE